MTYLAYTFTSCKRLELVVSGSNNVSLHRLSSETRSRKLTGFTTQSIALPNDYRK